MKNIFILGVCLLLGLVLFLLLSTTNNIVNFIPYSIHNLFVNTILSESVFIIGFDVLLSLVMSAILFLIIKKYTNK